MKVCIFLVFTLAPIAGALASEASVDHLTQRALDLDAHAAHGESVFRRSCVSCHGDLAQGHATQAIPALAGQRFKYIVRQLANFAGDEREDPLMQRVLSHPALKEHRLGWTLPLT